LIGSLEVGQPEDVEQFCSRGGIESVEPIAQGSFGVVHVHEGES
jgi:hypothetical protein